jgi:hypothetical protein
MNFATGVSVLLMLELMGSSTRSLVSAIAVIFVAWSFFTAFSNLLPLRVRDLELDGYIALIVSRNPRKLSVRLAAVKMRNHILNDKALSSMNPRWVALAVDEASGVVSLQSRAGMWIAYLYWVQRRQFDRAAAILERLLRTSADVEMNFKALLFAECAVLAALRGQVCVARTWKERSSELFLPEYVRRRCNSFVAWVEQDLDGAYREAVLAKEAVLKLDDRTQQIFLKSWALWIEELERMRNSVSEPVNA